MILPSFYTLVLLAVGFVFGAAFVIVILLLLFWYFISEREKQKRVNSEGKAAYKRWFENASNREILDGYDVETQATYKPTEDEIVQSRLRVDGMMIIALLYQWGLFGKVV